MAIAQRGTATLASSTGTSVSVPKPTGVASGDVLIVHLVQGNATPPTPPAGFTVAHSGAATPWDKAYVYTKVADGAEGASFVFTVAASGNKVASCVAYAGVNTSNIWDSLPQSGAASATTSFTAPSVPPGAAGRMLIAGVIPGNSPSSWTPPPGWTEILDQRAITEATLAHRQMDGASGTVTFTADVADTGHIWSGALRMASPPSQGAANGTYNYAGTASGAFPTSGNAAGGYNYEGMATGAKPYTGPAGNAAGGLNYTGAATGDKPVIWRQFTPPIRHERIPTDQKPFKFYQQQVAMCVVLRNGHFQEVRFPSQEETDQLAEGVSWFAGGRPYLVDDETATLLAGDGFTIT